MMGIKLIVTILISNVLRVLTRCHTDNLLELARHVTLTAEANFRGHLCQRLTLFDESLRMPDAYTFQIGIRRHAHFCPEGTQEIVRAERYVLRHRMQGHAFRKMFVNILACLPYRFFLPSHMSFT